jgi:cytochrome c553
VSTYDNCNMLIFKMFCSWRVNWRTQPVTLAGLALSVLWVLVNGVIATHASAQNLAAAALPANPLDTSAKRMQACTTCHGAASRGGRTANEAYFPRIAGKPAGYLFNQLQNFRDGRRHYGLMVGMVEYLDDAYLHEMAQYFAQLDLPYPPPMPPRAGTPASTLALGKALVLQGDATRGLPACAACHGAALMGMQPAIPALLGLPRDYMAGQIGAWQTGLRRAHAPDCMGAIAQKLTAQDVEALTTWLAAQPVPAGAKPAPRTALTQAAPLPQACGGLR